MLFTVFDSGLMKDSEAERNPLGASVILRVISTVCAMIPVSMGPGETLTETTAGPVESTKPELTTVKFASDGMGKDSDAPP